MNHFKFVIWLALLAILASCDPTRYRPETRSLKLESLEPEVLTAPPGGSSTVVAILSSDSGFNGKVEFSLGSAPGWVSVDPKEVEVFQKWEFTNLDFRQVEYLPDDFIYADPPYDVEFTKYTSGGFSWKDHVDLAKVLSSHLGPVVISNQATKRIVELYQKLGFNLKFLKGPRKVSRNGNRTPADEVLAYKNL